MMYRIIRALLVPLANRRIVEVRGLDRVPQKEPFILAANHLSWLDPLYLTAALARKRREQLLFIAATKKSAWTRAIIPIDHKQKDVCLHTAVGKLARGKLVAIFPMGDQRREHAEPKTGVARIAMWSGASVVPVKIAGAVFSHTWFSIWHFFRRGRHITISFGSPITFGQRDTMSKDEVLSAARSVMSSINALG